MARRYGGKKGKAKHGATKSRRTKKGHKKAARKRSSTRKKTVRRKTAHHRARGHLKVLYCTRGHCAHIGRHGKPIIGGAKGMKTHVNRHHGR